MHLTDVSPAVPAASRTPDSPTGALVKALTHTPDLLQRGGVLAVDVAAAIAGRSTLAPSPGDRRFADTTWTTHPVYRRLAQAYLAMERTVSDAVEHADVDWPTRERARFAAGIVTSALAPTNTLVGNPGALKHAFETGGASLFRGARNLVRDVAQNRGMPRQVDEAPFVLGENTAATPGEVVFRNDVVELIQYAPTTPKVRAVPLLLVWSVINRYYVLDLAPGRSFIEYAVSQGLTVFVTSWRNPETEHAGWDLDTYTSALLEIMDAIQNITGSDKVGTMGLCAGGQLLAATMAYLADKGDDRVAYSSLAVTQLDMSVPNASGIALHPVLERAARAGANAKGVVDGRDIASVFTWLRPNDLVWSQWVNNNLLGRTPKPFDILAWNNDTTRVASGVLNDLLDIAVDNGFADAEGLTVLGRKVGLRSVTADTYVVGAESDHLVPWDGAFRTAQMFGRPSTFVLSGGGHIQHLVNPPGNPKAHFRTGPAPTQDPESWRAESQKRAGSWWEHWSEWALARSGDERPAPKRAGSRKHRPVAVAPGDYVRQQ